MLNKIKTRSHNSSCPQHRRYDLRFYSTTKTNLQVRTNFSHKLLRIRTELANLYKDATRSLACGLDDVDK